MQTTIGNLVRLIVASFFIIGAIIGSVALYYALRDRALTEATQQADLLISSVAAVQDYTDKEVLPALDQQTFHRESVPFFASRQVFGRLAPSYPDYSFRQTALNPTNTDDRPDPFEVELTNRFKADRNLKELSGVREQAGGSLFYVARPIRIEDSSCLSCHSTPDRAPPGMIALYGTANGFGWMMHEIVGAEVLSIPVTRQLRSAVELSVGLAIGLLVLFGLTYVTLTTALDTVLVRPLRALSAAADPASRGGREVITVAKSSAAEIKELAAAIGRLRTSLDKALRHAAGGDVSDQPPREQ